MSDDPRLLTLDHTRLQDVAGLIDRCLLLRPDERPSAEEIFNFLTADLQPAAAPESNASGPGTPVAVLRALQPLGSSLPTGSSGSWERSSSVSLGRYAGSGIAEAGAQQSGGQAPFSWQTPPQDVPEIAESKPLREVFACPPVPPASLKALGGVAEGQARQPVARRKPPTPPPNPFEQCR